MSSLYQLTDEFLELYESDEIDEQKLEETALAIKGKSEKAALFLKSLEADSKQIDNVIAELNAKKKTIDNKHNSFKEYVKLNMERLGMEKLEAGIFRFTICKNSGKIPVLINLPPEEIDKKYHKTIISIDKESILSDFESSGVVPKGIEIGERGTHLRLK